MNLSIETFPRGDGFIAVAVPDGQLFSKGSIGGGITERAAIQEAINAFFTRRDAEEAASRLPLDGPVTPPPGSGLLREIVAVTNRDIDRLLTRALAETPTPPLTMTYRDAEDALTTRDIIPIRVENRPRGTGFKEQYLIALDPAKYEPLRTFKLDRIERLERA